MASLLILRLEEFPHLSDHDEKTSAELLCDYVATAISSNFRDADAIGCVGQGEFIVVLPDSSQSAARIVGERIRTAIESRSIPTCGGTSHLEIAVGVAVLDADVSIDEAISSAQNNALSALAHITD
jgi:diguanylate cyclase (GGDEF)-like protein